MVNASSQIAFCENVLFFLFSCQSPRNLETNQRAAGRGYRSHVPLTTKGVSNLFFVVGFFFYLSFLLISQIIHATVTLGFSGTWRTKVWSVQYDNTNPCNNNNTKCIFKKTLKKKMFLMHSKNYLKINAYCQYI